MPALEQEGIVLLDDGVRGSITFKNFRAPGRRHSWKRTWFRGSLVLTQRRFAAFTSFRQIIDVPLVDERIDALHCSLEGEEKLCVAFDPSVFNDAWSGSVEYRFRTPKARLFIDGVRRA